MPTERSTGKSDVELSTVRRVTIATAIGQFVEFYDYAVYGVLASTISVVFFPQESETASLLLTFSVFAASFVVRPLGGVFWGILGDRFGRKRTLVVVLTLMGLATIGVGILPGYSAIGITAPLLLVLFRLAQGFSAGGEVAGGDCFIGEYAPEGRRGAFTVWGQFGAYTALLVGTGIGALLTSTLGTDGLADWGWRIPFLLAAPMAIIGFYIRSHLEDSPKFIELSKRTGPARAPLREVLATPARRRAIMLAITIPALNGSDYYVLLAYMPTYMSKSLDFSGLQSLAITAGCLLAATSALPVAGWLSDGLGRKRMLAGSGIALAVLVLPYYWLLTQGSVWLAVTGGLIMAVVFAGHAGVIGIFLVELFPTRVRFTSYGLGYNISTMLFGGAAPLLMTYLISLTGNKSVPAYYLVATAVVTALSVWTTRETAHSPLSESWNDRVAAAPNVQEVTEPAG